MAASAVAARACRVPGMRPSRIPPASPASTTTPRPEQLAEITVMAAEEMMRFGFKPRPHLLSHSTGSSNEPSAVKMRKVLGLLLSHRRRGWK